ncbi:MAG: alpha/beta fold hydrolase, partial [Acidimicrobiia bacterium]|nr:alpha/beta fold hydrolase [Acidimicrobiia bacterium]
MGAGVMSWATASDGVRLHYEVIGRRSAPPVLMIQGLGADKHLWDLQRFVLATRYRVIAHDNRGAGRSDKPLGPYNLAQMADDAMAVLDHAGIENAHVVGASMGGAISQLVGILHADRVRSLSLVCTSCSNHQWRRDLLSSWADLALEKGMSEMTMQAARWVIGPRSLRRLWPAFSWLGPVATSREAHGFHAQVQAILDADDQIRLLKQVLEAEGVDDKRWPARVLMTVIQRWKDRGLTPEKVTKEEGSGDGNGVILQLYHDYQERLRTLNAADFGDLLLH